MPGDFDLFGHARIVFESIDSLEIIEPEFPGYFEEKFHYVHNFKKAVLLVIHAFSERFRKNLINEQEIMMSIADMVIQLFAAESALLRVDKQQKTKGEGIAIYKDIIDAFIY